MPQVQDICQFRFTGIPGGLTTRALALAVRIADAAARSDIEIHAETRWADGLRFFDCIFDASRGEDAVERLQAVTQALAYIEARGDVFPWSIKRHIAHPGWVHFEDKPEVPATFDQLVGEMQAMPSVEEVKRRQLRALLGLSDGSQA